MIEGSEEDPSGPDGTWYLSIGPSADALRKNNELDKGDVEPDYRCTAVIDGAAGSLVSGAGHTDLIDNVTWNPDSRLLEFRRVGATFWQWHRGKIAYGVYVGRFAQDGHRQSKPDISRYQEFASGWSSTYLDTGIIPRVYEVFIEDGSHGRLRLDRRSGVEDTYVGRLKTYHGPHGEEFEYDIDVRRWDGTFLEFAKHGDTPDSYEKIVEVYRATATGRLLVGTVDIAGDQPKTLRWKGARAEVLTHGLAPRSDWDLQGWQLRTRAQIQHLMMAGNPAAVTPDPPEPSTPLGVWKSPLPPGRDDDPASHPAAYSLTKLTFRLDIENPYAPPTVRPPHNTVKRTFNAYLAMPPGDPDHPPDTLFPAIIALNGHHGSAWTCMCPCSTLYWFGDGFARRGYVVLAVNVGHRTESPFYELFDSYAEGNTLQIPGGGPDCYSCSDGNGGDGPENPPQSPILMPHMGWSDWTDDGERVWNVLQAHEWLRQQPYIDDQRIFVTGMSLGGRIATYVGALEPRLAAVLPAGFSPDLGPRHNLGRSATGHRCNFWERADIREYIETSDLHALIAPRMLIVQTGKKDDTYSVFSPHVMNRTVHAYFAGDKQVARRSRAAYLSSPGAFVHYLHYDKHRYHTGVIAPHQSGAEQFVREPVTVEPPTSWSVDWQADPCTIDVDKTLFDFMV